MAEQGDAAPAQGRAQAGIVQKSVDAEAHSGILPVAGLPDAECAMGLSAVIEEQGGVKSYWALAHPDAKPDFHAPACFAATLPAANGA